MILDNIEHWEHYIHLSPGIAQGLKLLASGQLDTLADGKHFLDEDNFFASIQTYQPKCAEQCRWEAHRRYIDIQYLVVGQELMGYCPVDTLAVSEPYDEAKDIMFLGHGPERGTLLKVQPKMFAIFFPTDAHMPMLAWDEYQPEGQSNQSSQSLVKKIVLKIKKV